MIATAVVILGLTALGAIIVPLLHAAPGRGVLLGESFLTGCGFAALALFLLSAVGAPWSPVTLTVTLTAVTFVAWLLARRADGGSQLAMPDKAAPLEPRNRGARMLVTAASATTVLALAGYTIFAVVIPMWEWDFRAIWGLKARTFLELGGIDWRFLALPENEFVHPDYPLLLPLVFDAVSLLNGGWDDRALALLFPAFAASALLVFYGVLRRETSSPLAALAVVGAAGFACSPLVGLAETPLIAFSTAGLLLIRRGIDGCDRHLVAGSLFLGFAAFTKLEGATLLVAALVASVLAMHRTPRRLLHLWPAVAVAAPWLLTVRLLRLPNDITRGSAMSRLVQRLTHPGELLSALAAHPPNRILFWVAIVIALLVSVRHYRRREPFLLAAIGLQVAAFISAYAVTANDVDWQVATSWARLLNQLGMPLLFLAAIAIPGEFSEPPGFEWDDETKDARVVSTTGVPPSPSSRLR